jgi:hypothetical protein
MQELIGDITFTLCILFAWVLGLLAHFPRQPMILAYLIAGFFIGPFGMAWVKSRDSISVICERADITRRRQGRRYRLLSCAMASAKAARRRAMKPVDRTSSMVSYMLISNCETPLTTFWPAY